MIALRPYQVVAVDAAEAALAAHGSTLLVQATGTGKTVEIAELAARHFVAGGLRVLFVAHRRELLTQGAAALEARLGPDQRVTRRWREWPVARVLVVSIQSIARHLDEIPPDAFDLVVTDEAHHGAAPGYLRVYSHFAAARRLGVTATPDRADGVGLHVAYASCAARYDVAEAVRDGFLAVPRGVRVVVNGMDLSKVRQKVVRRDGAYVKTPDEGHPPAPRETGVVRDLHPGDLSRAALAPEAVEGVAGPLLELADDRRTVVFCVDRRHAKAIAAALCARRPGCARVVHGGMRLRKREEVLAAHRAGEYQFLCNVYVLTEGYDDPAIACVAMARPTQSRVLYAQAVGRGMRLHPGKRDMLLIDFVGVACQHDLVGPEDVLAGALPGPVRELRRASAQAGESPDYQPRSWRARFRARAVALIRGARRGVARAGHGVARFFRALLGD